MSVAATDCDYLATTLTLVTGIRPRWKQLLCPCYLWVYRRLPRLAMGLLLAEYISSSCICLSVFLHGGDELHPQNDWHCGK